jgi:hypothetical protein
MVCNKQGAAADTTAGRPRRPWADKNFGLWVQVSTAGRHRRDQAILLGRNQKGIELAVLPCAADPG